MGDFRVKIAHFFSLLKYLFQFKEAFVNHVMQKWTNFDPSSTLSHKLMPMLSKKLPPCPSLRDVIYECFNVCHSDPVCMRNIKCSFGSTLLLKII